MKENNHQILIVGDEEDFCESLSRVIKREGFGALVAASGRTALEIIRSEMPDVLLLDISMPDMDWMEILTRAKQLEPELQVVIIIPHVDVTAAAWAMRTGAYDYIAKPFEDTELIRIIRRALDKIIFERERVDLSNQMEGSDSLSKMMGPSGAIDRLVSHVNRVARSNFTVIILGETGVGKALVARAIHYASHKAGGPFVTIDCEAIPESVLDSELLGHEEGVFPNAMYQKAGKFEEAKGGTLLLDDMAFGTSLNTKITL